MRVEVRPALAMEEMFAEVVALAEAGRMTTPRAAAQPARRWPSLARRYDQEAHAPLLASASSGSCSRRWSGSRQPRSSSRPFGVEICGEGPHLEGHE